MANEKKLTKIELLLELHKITQDSKINIHDKYMLLNNIILKELVIEMEK